MTWKNILKAPLSEREMAEVREFMPEELSSAREDRKEELRGMLPELERRLESFRTAPYGLQRRSALQLLRESAEKAGMPDAEYALAPEILNFIRGIKVRNKGDRSNSGTAA